MSIEKKRWQEIVWIQKIGAGNDFFKWDAQFFYWGEVTTENVDIFHPLLYRIDILISILISSHFLNKTES